MARNLKKSIKEMLKGRGRLWPDRNQEKWWGKWNARDDGRLGRLQSTEVSRQLGSSSSESESEEGNEKT